MFNYKKIITVFKNHKFILFVIFIILAFIPSFFWGNLYIVGGDDTRLYYLFPREFLNNFVFNIASNNSLGIVTGYTSIAFFAPIIFIIFLVKQLSFMNVQFLMYGLNLAFGFLSFFLFLSLWVNLEDKYSFSIRIISSLFYIFSIFLIKTLFSNQLLSIYLISVIPTVLFLFIKAVETKKTYLVFASALVFSLFSSTLNTFPWSLAIFITLIPILLRIFWVNKKIFLIHTFIFILVLFLLNIYWLIHFLYPYLHGAGSTNLATYVNSDKFKEGGESLIYALSRLNSPLSQVFAFIRVSWTERYIFSINYIPNIIFITIVVWASLLLKKVNKKLKINYFVSVLGLLVTFFLFTPNFGMWSINLFTLMNNNIPFFAVFRNMYDKFAFSMAFYYAFALGISLMVVFNNIKGNKIKNLILIIVFIIAVFNARYFIFPQYNDNNFSTRISDFNKDYYDLTKYISGMNEASRFLWLPLTKASYVVIEDKNVPNHYYWGPSPLQILSNSSDYTGFLSFSTISDRNLGSIIAKDIDNKDFYDTAKNLQKLNVKYIVVNNSLTPELDKNSYLFDRKSYFNQINGLKKVLVGSKIKDFGKRYSLYQINNKFENDKLFLSNSFNTFSRDFSAMSYEKIANYEYRIHINNLTGEKKLIFLETNNKEWNLYINKNVPLVINKSYPAFGYANGWTISEKYIKENYDEKLYKINRGGGLELTLTLYFQPQRIAIIANMISLLTFFISLIVLIIFMCRDHFNKYLVRYLNILLLLFHKIF